MRSPLTERIRAWILDLCIAWVIAQVLLGELLSNDSSLFSSLVPVGLLSCRSAACQLLKLTLAVHHGFNRRHQATQFVAIED